jgi:hypothetical protein
MSNGLVSGASSRAICTKSMNRIKDLYAEVTSEVLSVVTQKFNWKVGKEEYSLVKLITVRKTEKLWIRIWGRTICTDKRHRIRSIYIFIYF